MILGLLPLPHQTLANSGGGAGGGTPPANSKEALEYSKKSGQLQTLQSKVEELEKHRHHLSEENKHPAAEATKKRIAEELIKVSKDLKRTQAEMVQLKQELEYKYPNKGQPIEGHFLNPSKDSVKRIQSESALDQKLRRVTENAIKKYQPLVSKEVLEAEAAEAQHKKVLEDQKPKKLRLEK